MFTSRQLAFAADVPESASETTSEQKLIKDWKRVSKIEKNGKWVENLIKKVLIFKQSPTPEQPSVTHESNSTAPQPGPKVKSRE